MHKFFLRGYSDNLIVLKHQEGYFNTTQADEPAFNNANNILDFDGHNY